jgi:hypothetical protein
MKGIDMDNKKINRFLIYFSLSLRIPFIPVNSFLSSYLKARSFKYA